LGTQGPQKTRHACGLGLDNSEVVSGHLIFGLPF
jgi:hypothetical protein